MKLIIFIFICGIYGCLNAPSNAPIKEPSNHEETPVLNGYFEISDITSDKFILTEAFKDQKILHIKNDNLYDVEEIFWECINNCETHRYETDLGTYNFPSTIQPNRTHITNKIKSIFEQEEYYVISLSSNPSDIEPGYGRFGCAVLGILIFKKKKDSNSYALVGKNIDDGCTGHFAVAEEVSEANVSGLLDKFKHRGIVSY